MATASNYNSRARFAVADTHGPGWASRRPPLVSSKPVLDSFRVAQPTAQKRFFLGIHETLARPKATRRWFTESALLSCETSGDSSAGCSSRRVDVFIHTARLGVGSTSR